MILWTLFILLLGPISLTLQDDDDKGYTVKVINGFLKADTGKTEGMNEIPVRKCWNSSTEYSAVSYVKKATFSNICENDPGYYQYCGVLETSVFHDKLSDYGITEPLCGSFICSQFSFFDTEHIGGLKAFSILYNDCMVNKTTSCTALLGKHCESAATDNTDSNWFQCGLSGEVVPKAWLCDSHKDCVYGEDEVGCGHPFGLECERTWSPQGTMWRGPMDLCQDDTDSECRGDVDLIGSEVCKRADIVGTCKGQKDSTTTLYNLQRCGGRPLTNSRMICLDGTDQINCTNSNIVYTCPQVSTGHNITLTHVVLCHDEMALCADGINNKCEAPESNCKIHRHFLCDGIRDCDNGFDEKGCADKETERECVRRVHKNDLTSATKILKDWVRDGVRDCEDGIDEDPHSWKECWYEAAGQTVKLPYSDPKYPCSPAFICNPESENVTLISSREMCNGKLKQECPKESKLCKISRGQTDVEQTANGTKTLKYLSPFCSENNHTDCKERVLEESFGTVPIKIMAPTERLVQCSSKFGENYVYSSCLGVCTNSTIPCPLRDIHYITSCPNLDNRVLTLTHKSQLTFVEPFEQDKFINRELFSCKNGKCIPYEMVCNLINDCGDNSDEENCHNHFSCDGDSKTELIKLSQMCDGKVDCSNYADECDETLCPSQYNKKILTPVVLQFCGWVIGTLAVVFNTLMIIRNIRKLINEKKKGKVVVTISTLVTLVAFGDFCVGLYLICISIENVVRREEFCVKEWSWLTSSSCELYGVISTFGSELTVFAMTALAIYRAYVMRNIRTTQRSTKSFLIKLFSVCFALVVAALLIAVIPTIPSLVKLYFYNGYYIENAPLFLGAQRIRSVQFKPLLDAYFEEDHTHSQSTVIKEKVKRMFSNPTDPDGEEIKLNILGFYGSSGSCTFKFFVDNEDPQKHYTWTILIINLLCLMIITGGYLSVHLFTQKSANKVGAHPSRYGSLQRKITFIIFTDFLCWFPFIVVCFLHFIEVINADILYPTFSTVVLPINSIINPILYDTRLNSGISTVARRISLVTRRLSGGHGVEHRTDTVVYYDKDKQQISHRIKVPLNTLTNLPVTQEDDLV